MLRLMSFVCCVVLAAPSLAQQAVQAPSQNLKGESSSSGLGSIHPVKDFEQFAPYWTCEPGWHTELQLRNNLSSDKLTVRPALRQPDGTETELASVTLQPGEVQSIDVMDVLMKANSPLAGAANAYGSVVLRYTAKAKRNLYGSVMVHEMGRPIMYHLDAVNQAPKWRVGSREGIWWLPSKAVRDYLVLTNQADHKIAGTLKLYDSTGKLSEQPIQLTARQTLRLSVRDLIEKAAFTGDFGGIQVSMDADAGSLDTVHILYDETAGFSATMKMFDRDPASTQASRDYAETGKWVTRAPMLALAHPDPALAFPSKTVLHPVVFVRNASLATAHVSTELHWRSATWSGVASYPMFSLASEEVKKLDVSELQRNGTIPKDATWAQVSLTTDTAPDDVTAVAASYDSTLRYGAQTPFSDQLSGHLEGGEWRVDANHTSIIAAGNGGNQPVSALMTLRFNAGKSHYELRKLIAAHDQWFVNLGDLIRSGTPDANGTVLPANLVSGAYSLQEDKVPVKNWLFEGKVITDKTYGHATYGCMICCGYGGDAGPVTISPSPSLINFDDSGSFDIYGDNACNGASTSLDGYMASSSSDNTSIMTVSSRTMSGVGVGATMVHANLSRVPSGDGEDQRTPCPVEAMAPSAPEQTTPTVSLSGPTLVALSGTAGVTNTITLTATGSPGGGSYSWTSSSSAVSLSNTSNASVTVTGQSGGVANVDVQYTLNGQSDSDDQDVTVQVPTSLPVAYDSSNSPVMCGSGSGGWLVAAVRQLSDQNGTPIAEANETLNEQLGTLNPNGLGLAQPSAASGMTDANGQRTDTFGFCAPACASQNSNTSTLVQTVSDGTKYPLGTYTVVYSCTGITIH